MDYNDKGKSPFYPGQPVPIDFFTGRLAQVERISRSLIQTENGKPQAIFLSGEYGIGKSSLAGFTKYLAERKNHLLGIHVLLGGINRVEDLASKVVETILREQIIKERTGEKIKNALSKYVGKQELFGFSINFDALNSDSLNISKGFLPFLSSLYEKVKEDNIKGIYLIFDEVNGIAKNPNFSHFIKSLVDDNALSRRPLPLMLMVCGIEERRSEMIREHPPIERIFDIIDIEPMSNEEMKEFYRKTFRSVNIEIEQEALKMICHYASGYPKIMHIIGDTLFWNENDNLISKQDAIDGIFQSAEEIGRKFVNEQVLKALHSKDYKSILGRVVETPILTFKKVEIEKKLTLVEKKKFHNFLQRMKKLNAIKSSERGEYEFNNRMVPLYLYLNQINQQKIKGK
ncbi:MAG: ATP-binding protein [Ignavibacteriaceae bacterium]